MITTQLLARLEGRMAKITPRLWDTVRHNWHLGFTAFGGPPVHFKIFEDKFVHKLEWVDEQLFQELFSLTQFLSGPASTKMIFCINLIHTSSLTCALLAFLLWSIPGAIGMYALSLGVSSISETLPGPVYALLSGLNSATVGIIAVAAVQLSEKAITDKVSRVIVFLGAASGMMYNAVWYLPVLMVLGASLAVAHDGRWAQRFWRSIKGCFSKRARVEGEAEENQVEMQAMEANSPEEVASNVSKRPTSKAAVNDSNPGDNTAGPSTQQPQDQDSASTSPRTIPPSNRINMSWKVGLLTITTFLLLFTLTLLLRYLLPSIPLLYALYSNLFLAGTIIFGGGPVVIPLLRSYIVSESWVSPRDFLIGLAIIQAFPGPNFNFAVYLGALTAINGGHDAAAGAVLGYLGIFLPGMVLVHGTLGVWSAVRGWRVVRSAVRGVNAAAVGLIYTAVYRLWQIGYIDEQYREGTSLGLEPWWVVVTATSYVGGKWFGVSPPVAIVLGVVMGMIWYGVKTA